jgi:hypothetical protein
MQFRYTPEGADTMVFEYDPKKLLSPEAEKVETLTGWSYAEFGQQLLTGSMKAYHALLYVFLKRSDPTLKYDQVVFSFGEIDLAFDDQETELMIEELQRHAAEEGLDDDTQAVLDGLLAERTWKTTPTDDEGEGDPKAVTSASSAGDTSGT